MSLTDPVDVPRANLDSTVSEYALAKYEELRRPRTERIVATGRRRRNYNALKSRAAVLIREWIMPTAFKWFATEKAMSWIYDYEVDWDQPVEPRDGRPQDLVATPEGSSR